MKNARSKINSQEEAWSRALYAWGTALDSIRSERLISLPSVREDGRGGDRYGPAPLSSRGPPSSGTGGGHESPGDTRRRSAGSGIEGFHWQSPPKPKSPVHPLFKNPGILFD
eukprot:Polyplicarium_translucidae@DN4786_c0_g1_i1.p1